MSPHPGKGPGPLAQVPGSTTFESMDGRPAQHDDIASVASLLDQVFGLDTLWLFGSVARGRDRADSDIDLAALFRRRPSAKELLDVRADVERRLSRAVDLIDLEQASPIVARQVLRNGVLLVDGSPAHRTRFVSGLPGRYEDLLIVRRNVERALLERLRGQNGRP